MDLPDLSHAIETFIRIRRPPSEWLRMLKESYDEDARCREAQRKPYLDQGLAWAVPPPPSWEDFCYWHGYSLTLRRSVGPLVRRLAAEGVINWYAFLVHDRKSGVPTTLDDNRPYVHLRMALTPSASEADLLAQLPPECLMTQRMVAPDPPTLDGVRIEALAGKDVRLGWKALGAWSECVLDFLDAHEPEQPIPVANIEQFMHYLGNQLQLSALGIRTP